MAKNYFILMGDVIESRKLDATKLRQQLKTLLSACNKDLKPEILSPYTTTLGDEFQGIAGSLHAVAETIFCLDEARIKKQYDFMIRYVAHYGEIQTPINTDVAYGMMGPGLTKARALLTEKRRGEPRFCFELPDTQLAENLTRLFTVIDGLTDRWKQRDFSLIADMLSNTNNEEVAAKHKKNRSQIWKKRKHLLIEEYRAAKAIIFDLIKASAGRQNR
jgi:hypothetical protein